jgi:hypothetical protein
VGEVVEMVGGGTIGLVKGHSRDEASSVLESSPRLKLAEDWILIHA